MRTSATVAPLPAMFEEFEKGCELDTAELLADEEEWKRRPGRAHLPPEFGQSKKRRKGSQVPMFDDSPLLGGSDA